MDWDDCEGDELDYVHLQDYTHSTIDVHIQGKTTHNQDISLYRHVGSIKTVGHPKMGVVKGGVSYRHNYNHFLVTGNQEG